jgi:YbbR domain-containing protein
MAGRAKSGAAGRSGKGKIAMRFRDLVLHNFWWKLLSLLVAVLMWLTIQTAFRRDQSLRESPVVNSDTRDFSLVPVKILTSTPNVYHYAADPASVAVEISGSVDDLAQLQEKQVHAFVDVTDAGDEKQFRRAIQVEVPGNLKVENLKPTFATVERVALPGAN